MEDINKKDVFYRALPESPNPKPFFGRQNSRFESQLRKNVGRGERYTNSLKKQLKVQYIGIFEEIDSFY